MKFTSLRLRERYRRLLLDFRHTEYNHVNSASLRANCFNTSAERASDLAARYAYRRSPAAIVAISLRRVA